MTESDVIARLREIQQLRERHADEIVFRRQKAVSSAGAVVRTASDAVALFVDQAVAKERETFRLLMGRPVSSAALQRVQGQAEKATREIARLYADQTSAHTALTEREVELSRAREVQVGLRKAVMKLDDLIEHVKKRTARHRIALDELAAEDDRSPMHSATMR